MTALLRASLRAMFLFWLVGALPIAAAPPQRWAMLVGVDQYIKIENLEFAGNDQRELASELLQHGFPADQILILHDLAKQKRNLPFRENIERELKLMLKAVGPGDLVVFAFSGHGVHIDGKSYLCPTEADFERPNETLIPLDSVFERLRNSKASLKLMFVDASRDAKQSRSVTNGFQQSLEAPPEGLIVLTSSSPGQISMEDSKLQHSVFMYHLLEGLKGKAAISDGTITLSGLFDYVSLATTKYVANRWGDSQRPRLKGELPGAIEFSRVTRKEQRHSESAAEESVPADSSNLTGTWSGQYNYPVDATREVRDPVAFSMILIQDGHNIAGFIKEKNTFGRAGDPWLHASFRGTYDPATLRIDWIKTYDGTADVAHDVHYSGRIASNGQRVNSGTWQIPQSWGSTFTLVRNPGSHAGKWSGVWTGTHYFPEVLNKSPFKFSMLLVHEGTELVGYINERKSFEIGEDPWFHATVRGRVDATKKEFSFVKSYDGTAGRTEQINYQGTFSEERPATIDGSWTSRNSGNGTFTILKAPSSQ